MLHPRHLAFGFLTQTPGLALVNVQPLHCRHVINLYPPPYSIATHCCFIWHTWNQAMNSWFRVFGPNLPYHLTLMNMQPPCSHHLYPPHSSIIPHCCFTWHTWNWAMNTWFQVCGPNLPHCLTSVNALMSVPSLYMPKPVILCLSHASQQNALSGWTITPGYHERPRMHSHILVLTGIGLF